MQSSAHHHELRALAAWFASRARVGPHRFARTLVPFVLVAALASGTSSHAQVGEVIDVAGLSTGPDGTLHRTYGSTGFGAFGVPVAGGVDVNDDGLNDFAMAAFNASPFGRDRAGEVYLILGDGKATGVVDTGAAETRVLVFGGEGEQEYSGSEIWMDDVTGDSIGDLLIARQNFNPGARVGAGALSIVVGGPALTARAAAGEIVDLGAPPADVKVTTIVGGTECGRFGIWVRSGDVTGDGVSDLVIGADQEGLSAQPQQIHPGAAFVIRGGAHLATGAVLDLADFNAAMDPTLDGDVVRIVASSVAADHAHFGATVQIGDLDGDDVGEVFFAEALNRAGASLDPPGMTCDSDGTGGTIGGTLHIAWADNFAGDPWPSGFQFALTAAPGTVTRIDGNAAAVSFGEEILAGHDFDGNGNPDLFVGDIVGDQTGGRAESGYGYVFYDAAGLAGLDVEMTTPPPGLVVSLVQGARGGDLAGDTAAGGDFNGDGIDDLAVASPHFDPPTRSSAGGVHVLHGQPTPWPALIDLLNPPAPEEVFISEVWGAEGGGAPGTGDTLGYSAAAGLIDGDGRVDLISNEMLGDGLQPGTTDVGNLIVLSGTVFAPEPNTVATTIAALASLAALAGGGARRRAPAQKRA